MNSRQQNFFEGKNYPGYRDINDHARFSTSPKLPETAEAGLSQTGKFSCAKACTSGLGGEYVRR